MSVARRYSWQTLDQDRWVDYQTSNESSNVEIVSVIDSQASVQIDELVDVGMVQPNHVLNPELNSSKSILIPQINPSHIFNVKAGFSLKSDYLLSFGGDEAIVECQVDIETNARLFYKTPVTVNLDVSSFLERAVISAALSLFTDDRRRRIILTAYGFVRHSLKSLTPAVKVYFAMDPKFNYDLASWVSVDLSCVARLQHVHVDLALPTQAHIARKKVSRVKREQKPPLAPPCYPWQMLKEVEEARKN